MKHGFEYDLIVIGLGPAGMAVSVMGSEMGLRVCAIERHKIGGECMNAGCIPSKSLLRMAAARHLVTRLPAMELAPAPAPAVQKPFARIQEYLRYINETKTAAMFKKADLVLGKGAAEFVDPHTVEVGGRRITAKRIFIATGTRPARPPIPGLDQVDVLTNENLFALPALPASLAVIGGGAIGCEMAQAFNRLGCPATIVHMDPYLLPHGPRAAGDLLEAALAREHIKVLNGRQIRRVAREDGLVALYTDREERVAAAALLLAAGRQVDVAALHLERAGVAYDKRGITINQHLQTTQRHIYAVGDCNGQFLLSHAAMHQGMIALMNAMMPPFMRLKYRNFMVPWAVFTDPPVAAVGQTEAQLQQAGRRYEVVTQKYEDYGAAIAEDCGVGYVQVLVSPAGRLYGASIVGEGAPEMINEWALALQRKTNMFHVMMLQHAFPSMSFLNKRVAETWMMNRMKTPWIRRMIRMMF